MTAEQVKALLQTNRAMYKLTERQFTDAEVKTQLAVWSAALKEFPHPVVQQAMLRAFTVCRFPVTLADLFDQLRAIQAENAVPVARRWAGLLQTAHRALDNAAMYGYTFRGKDGVTQGQAAKAANRRLFGELPPEEREWLGSLEELVRLAREDAQGLSYRRAQFERFMKERPCKLDPAQLLPAARERKEAAQEC